MTTISTYPFTDTAYAKLRDLALAGEDHLVKLVRRLALPLLRVAMSLVFFWFGALKVADVTPVGDLVAGTLPFLDRNWLVPGMGAVEVLLGIGLLAGWSARIVLPVMIGHLTGTFLVLVVQPQVAFQDGNPLLLTTTGEFVVKNLVLISAAMVLLARTGHRRA
jgi:putative oxidoreductase